VSWVRASEVVERFPFLDEDVLVGLVSVGALTARFPAGVYAYSSMAASSYHYARYDLDEVERYVACEAARMLAGEEQVQPGCICQGGHTQPHCSFCTGG
jgi:hypothetical protein